MSIKDNGVGFPPDAAERVFQPFQRLGQRKAQRGTGLGLSICKRVIDRHGGNIWAESEPGEGSVFTFALPEDSPLPELAAT